MLMRHASRCSDEPAVSSSHDGEAEEVLQHVRNRCAVCCYMFLAALQGAPSILHNHTFVTASMLPLHAPVDDCQRMHTDTWPAAGRSDMTLLWPVALALDMTCLPGFTSRSAWCAARVLLCAAWKQLPCAALEDMIQPVCGAHALSTRKLPR